MFGAPDDQDLVAEETGKRKRATLSILEREDEIEEEGWPYGSDPDLIFFLNERVSPSRLRFGDRAFIIAMAITLLLHATLLLQLRSNSFMAGLTAARVPAPRPMEKEKVTPFYFYEMPNQKKETPSRRAAPLSDMDRRAHGGQGEPSNTPGSRGNTEELRLTPPGAGQDGAGQADQRVAQAPDKDQGKDGEKEREGQESTQKIADTGSSAVLVVPKTDREGEGHGGRLRGLPNPGRPGGAGGLVPNRPGGRVDLGPLAFDTQWYEWGPYAAEMLRRIRYHWEIPEIARMGVGGIVRIRFFIERDGRVTGLTIESESPHPSMNFAARDAILNASPLPPLPADLTDVEREGVTIAFYYNTPIPESS